jgi:hypothetical protein
MNTKPTIVIVGCGNLGKRYIQSIEENLPSFELYLVDPVPFTSKYPQFRDISELSLDKIDLAIVTTCSNVRFPLIRELLRFQVKYMLLEKILFQKREEYVETQRMLKEHNIKAWVHTPRRAYEYYRKLKNELTLPLKMKVSGINWGMACNLVHFLDLYCYLTDTQSLELKHSELKVIDSKRKNFKELIGRIESVNGNFVAECEQGDGFLLQKQFNDLLLTNTNGYLVNERGEKVFKVPYASESVHQFISSILSSGTCVLPTFEKSCNIHLPMIQSFTKEFAKNNIQGCPVT